MNTEWPAWWRLPQKLRFLVAGGYNTVFGYLLFGAMFLWLGRWVHYLVIAVIAHLIAVINAFIVQRFLVFRATDRWQSSFIRFNLSQVMVLLFGMSALYGLVEYGGFSPLLAQAFVTVFSVSLSYFLHRHFSFRDHSSGDGSGAPRNP